MSMSNEENKNQKRDSNSVNSQVIFSQSKVANLLRRMEQYLGIPLSIRSTTGEVVCKTDYFSGPCSFIRGTRTGCERCRKVYRNIEKKIMRRKVPFVCLCYSGFLIFAIPLEFRGEMVGTLFGSQILPVSNDGSVSEFRQQLEASAKELSPEEKAKFYDSFDKIKTLDSNSQRVKFLNYMSEIGRHFVEMAIADKPWNVFLKEMESSSPEFGVF